MDDLKMEKIMQDYYDSLHDNDEEYFYLPEVTVNEDELNKAIINFIYEIKNEDIDILKSVLEDIDIINKPKKDIIVNFLMDDLETKINIEDYYKNKVRANSILYNYFKDSIDYIILNDLDYIIDFTYNKIKELADN